MPCPPPGIFQTQGWNPHLFMSPALAGRFFPTGATFRRNKPGKARRKGPECTKQRREPLTDVRDFRANGRKTERGFRSRQ